MQENTQPVSGRTAGRQSNIELLRIVAMVMIVAHHFSVHSGFSFPDGTLTLNRVWLQLLQYGGKIGVDLFVLVTGYFSVTSLKFKAEKLVRTWGATFFWSVVTLIVFVAVGLQEFDGFALFHRCLPIIFQEYWFVTAYFLLVLFSPFINLLLNRLDRRQCRALVLLLLGLFCVVPSFFGFTLLSNDLLWFTSLYVFAAYLRLHGSLRIWERKKKTAESGKAGKERGSVKKERGSGAYFLYAGITILVVMGLTALLDALHLPKNFFRDYLYNMQMLPVFLASVFIFMGFLKLKIGQLRFINVIASATFGVYLIHDNYYVRVYIWKTLFRNPAYTESPLLIPHSLWVVAVVFIVCTLLELLRMLALERWYMKGVRKVAGRIEERKARKEAESRQKAEETSLQQD